MSEARICFEDCSAVEESAADQDSCKKICVQEAKVKYAEVQDMTEQMV